MEGHIGPEACCAGSLFALNSIRSEGSVASEGSGGAKWVERVPLRSQQCASVERPPRLAPHDSSQGLPMNPPSPEEQSLPPESPADRIGSSAATIAVVGLGYVGLPVVAAFLAAGQRVIGFDIDPEKIDAVTRGESYLRHIPAAQWQEFASSERFSGTTDPSRFAEADAVLLCVPTPLAPHREPDLSFVEASARSVASHLRPGALVVLESTSYPGTTREVLAPIFEAAGHSLGESVFLAYSPERTDPGREDPPTVDVPKLVGGLDAVSGELANALYSIAYATVESVSSAEVAESAKLLENVYRAVNIALVNELKLILEKMDIDVWEVIDAAATKPYGFQAFRPGPGLGGHCIPIDPFYLTWKAQQVGFPTRFIELAGEINTAMPEHVVRRAQSALAESGGTLEGSRILVLGVAYKPDVDDTRETPAAEIITRLLDAGAEVSYHDPWVPKFPRMRRYDLDLESIALEAEALRSHDGAIVVTDHTAIDWDLIGAHVPLIIDTRNVYEGRAVAARVVKA